MYMQTVLNTWFQESYLHTVFSLWDKSTTKSVFLNSKLMIHLDFGRYKIRFRSTANENGDKKHCKGWEIVPRSNRSTRSAKDFKTGYSLIQMPDYSFTLWKVEQTKPLNIQVWLIHTSHLYRVGVFFFNK
ncbi:UNVERIFIED_CONTAM: hypothetical protein K2H54_015389 [Gekko kuhli]